MYRIALNTAIATFRKNKIALEFTGTLPKNLGSGSNISHSDNEEKMFHAIRKLGESERAIIALFLEDYSHRDIANIVGITENYVGVKISRIKEKIKKILNQ